MGQIGTLRKGDSDPSKNPRPSRTTRDRTEDDILNGWKEIGKFLHCSAKTAQRWADSDDLPILRPVTRSKAPVLASKRALDAWLKGGVEHVALTDTKLIALDRRSRILWSYEFQHSLRNYGQDELEWRLRIVDLKGEGERGVLLAARFSTQQNPNTLFYFSSSGKIDWRLEADPLLRNRDGLPFDRAWAFKDIAVTPTSGGPVWAALGNHAGWAGCVLRIDPRGRATVQFANAGYVERLCPVTLQNGNFIIACGENNDFDQAFVALLGADDAPAGSPFGERLVYRFSNAPTGAPSKYILFPRTELNLARQSPYGHATRITQHADGIIVEVETGGNGGSFLYHFSKSLEPRYVFPSGSHEFVHQSLEKTGAITHSWLNCPEMQTPLFLRTWEPDSGWYDQPIPWRDNPWKELQIGSA
jgi:hypothetical protein